MPRRFMWTPKLGNYGNIIAALSEVKMIAVTCRCRIGMSGLCKVEMCIF
jgi:hypothetical protein